MQIASDFILLFVQNIIFQNLLGLPSAANTIQKGKGLLRLGVLTVLFCTIGSGTLAVIRPLIPNRYEKLLFPLGIALICGILDLLLVLICRFSKRLNRIIMPVLHSAAFSSAVLGAVLLSTDYTHDIAVAFRFGFRTGLGYFIACLMLKAAVPLLNSEAMPKSIRGWKGMLLYAALLSMAAACLFP